MTTLRNSTPEPIEAEPTFELVNSRFDLIRHGVALARDVLLILVLLALLFLGTTIYRGLAGLGESTVPASEVILPQPYPDAPDCLGEEPVVGCPD